MNWKQHRTLPGHDTTLVRRRRTVPLALLLCLATSLSLLPPPISRAAGTGATGLTAQLDNYLGSLAAQSRFSGSVLVARQGTVLLSKGYGLADREHKVPNTPNTPFGVSGVQGSFSILGPLWLEDHGLLSGQAPICRYLTQCPDSWQPITVHMALDGSSGLPGFGTDTPGRTTEQSLRIMQAEPLDHAPGASVGYQNGEVLVLSLVAEKVSGQPWGTFIRRAFLDPVGMAHSGRLTPSTAPQALAQGYSGQTRNDQAVGESSSFFALYATAPDVYAYDNALFGGKLISPRSLHRLFAPRAPDPEAQAGFEQARYGYWWSSAQVAGHHAVYTVRGSAANLRFEQDGVTVIVLSNDDQNDAGDIALHLAGFVFGRPIAAPAMPAHAVAPARAVVATFRGQGQVGTFPFALTPGALWFPYLSQDGHLSVVRLDSRNGHLVAMIPVNTANVRRGEPGPGSVAVAHGQVWAVDTMAQRLVHINPATNKIATTISLDFPPAGLAVAGDTLWVTADSGMGDAVARVDLRTQKVVAVIRQVGHPWFLGVATPDALWYISTDSGKVVRLDAATNKVVATIAAGPVPEAVFVGAGSVWVGDASGNLVSRIDPRTNRVVASIKTEGYPGNRQPSFDNCACRYAADDSAVWVIANNTTLLRIDPRTNRPVASLTFDADIGSVGLSEGSVWVATDGGNPAYTIYRVDPQAMQ
jgi:CubicO group peptidase (beta-lactamase class C family)/streptogramin lyase